MPFGGEDEGGVVVIEGVGLVEGQVCGKNTSALVSYLKGVKRTEVFEGL